MGWTLTPEQRIRSDRFLAWYEHWEQEALDTARARQKLTARIHKNAAYHPNPRDEIDHQANAAIDRAIEADDHNPAAGVFAAICQPLLAELLSIPDPAAWDARMTEVEAVMAQYAAGQYGEFWQPNPIEQRKIQLQDEWHNEQGDSLRDERYWSREEAQNRAEREEARRGGKSAALADQTAQELKRIIRRRQ